MNFIFHLISIAQAGRLQFDVQRSSLPFEYQEACLTYNNVSLELSLNYEEDLLRNGDSTILSASTIPPNFFLALVRNDVLIYPKDEYDLMSEVRVEVEAEDELVVMVLESTEDLDISQWREFKCLQKWTARFTTFELAPITRTPCYCLDWTKLSLGIFCTIALIMAIIMIPSWFLIRPVEVPVTTHYVACSELNGECHSLVFNGKANLNDIVRAFEEIFGLGNVNQSSIHTV